MSRPSASRRVAVTGLGAVSALAANLPGTWAAILAGRSGIAPFLPGRTAAAARDFDGGGIDARRLAQLDRGAQLALAAAREAWADAAPPPSDPARRAAVLGAIVGLDTLDQAYKRLYGEGNPRVHPLTVPRGMPSGGASAVSAEFGLRGPSFAVASACASAAHAIAQATLLIRAELADLVVTGGADAPLTPGNLRAWEALRVLSPDVCRPFSADRLGTRGGRGRRHPHPRGVGERRGAWRPNTRGAGRHRHDWGCGRPHRPARGGRRRRDARGARRRRHGAG